MSSPAPLTPHRLLAPHLLPPADSLGDASTAWGALRIADGHPEPYTPLAWELGNEQYNAQFVQQVAAMEARAAAIGKAPTANFYMFPDNGGLTQADQAAAVAAGLPIERIATDVHVGSAGGAQQLSALFAASPSFPASGINGEVNAIYGDNSNGASALERALSEAADIDAWFNSKATDLARIIARTASFCSERNGHDDGSQWHQGLTFFVSAGAISAEVEQRYEFLFFPAASPDPRALASSPTLQLPHMSWLGPAGQLHAMLAKTWAPGALAVDYNAKGPVSVSAQKDEAGGRVVVRIANANPNPAVVQLIITGFASQTTVHVTTLNGTSLAQTNTPTDPYAIAPVASQMQLPSGGGNVTVPAYSVTALELFAA